MTGGWDCHAHLFGPYDRYPLAASAVHAPPVADAQRYAALLQRLGLQHAVLVQPSAYAQDHGLLLQALADQPLWRGVVVPAPDRDSPLQGLHGRGIRGARFSHRPGQDFAGSARLADLLRLAPALADAGLHAHLWTTRQALPDIEARLTGLPLPLVIDHMAGFDPAGGLDEPGFVALRRLLASGRAWVKLCSVRSLAGHPREAADPYVQALAAEHPQQLLWGSDWPHLNLQPLPDAADLLQDLRRALPQPALQQAVLVDNPHRLFA